MGTRFSASQNGTSLKPRVAWGGTHCIADLLRPVRYAALSRLDDQHKAVERDMTEPVEWVVDQAQGRTRVGVNRDVADTGPEGPVGVQSWISGRKARRCAPQ